MTRKEFDKTVAALLKWINSNLEAVGLSEPQLISPKLSLEETETILDSLQEHILDFLGENPPQEEMAILFNIVAEALGAMQAEDQGSAGQDEPPLEDAPPPSLTQPKGKKAAAAPATQQKKTEEVSQPKADPPKKKTAPAKKQSSEPKPTVAADDKDKAIKKLFEALSPEAIDTLDPTTARIVLKLMK